MPNAARPRRAPTYTGVQAHLERAADEEGAAVVELLTELVARPEVSSHPGRLPAGSDLGHDMPGAPQPPARALLIRPDGLAPWFAPAASTAVVVGER